MLFMLDSGSEASLINRKVYEEIPPEQRPPLLNETPNLVTASEEKLKIYGKVVMTVTVRDVQFSQAFWVSDMIEDGIFGVDMLRAQAAQVDFRRAKLFMRGKSIAIQTSRGRPIHTKVITLRAVCIPPSTECVLAGKVCATKRQQEARPKQALLEPAQLFYQKTGGIICKELVDATRSTVPIRIYNPCKYPIYIPAHITVGVLSEVLEVKVRATKPPPIKRPPPNKQKTRVQQIQHVPHHYMDQEEDTQWANDYQQTIEPGEVLPEHMQDLYERSVDKLPNEYHTPIAQLLIRNADVFASSKSDLGRTHLVKHKIETGQEEPVRDPPRRLPMAQTAEVHEQVKTLHQQGIIEPCDGQWASNIVMVKKKDGTMRMCIDYRELNLKTKNQDPYMLPRIDETLDRLNSAKYFTILDMLMGYHQVELEEDSKDKTGFQVPKMYPSHWRFKYMPFGLSGAPRTFQRLIDKLLSYLPMDIAMAYLDDIIVFSQTIDEGITRLEAVFGQLRAAGLKLKAKKCELFRTRVLYLGHIVTAEGITTDPDKITAILAWRAPRTAKQSKRFLATVSYYRRFIPKFAGIAEPLINLQRKRVKFDWTPACQEAFETLRTCLVTAPVLAYPKDEGLYILDTDASEHSISGALSQMQLNDDNVLVERMIANASKTLNAAERRYCVRRREMKAIVNFAKHFRPYLYGRNVLFRTDHASLRYIQTMRNGSDQFHRWMEVLSEFQYKIEIRRGALHVNADGLSRLGCNGKQCVCDQVDQFERTPGIINNHNVVCSVTTASSLFCVTGVDGVKRMKEVETSSSNSSVKSRVNVAVVQGKGRRLGLDELTEEWNDRNRMSSQESTCEETTWPAPANPSSRTGRARGRAYWSERREAERRMDAAAAQIRAGPNNATSGAAAGSSNPEGSRGRGRLLRSLAESNTAPDVSQAPSELSYNMRGVRRMPPIRRQGVSRGTGMRMAWLAEEEHVVDDITTDPTTSTELTQARNGHGYGPPKPRAFTRRTRRPGRCIPPAPPVASGFSVTQPRTLELPAPTSRGRPITKQPSAEKPKKHILAKSPPPISIGSEALPRRTAATAIRVVLRRTPSNQASSQSEVKSEEEGAVGGAPRKQKRLPASQRGQNYRNKVRGWQIREEDRRASGLVTESESSDVSEAELRSRRHSMRGYGKESAREREYRLAYEEGRIKPSDIDSTDDNEDREYGYLDEATRNFVLTIRSLPRGEAGSAAEALYEEMRAEARRNYITIVDEEKEVIDPVQDARRIANTLKFIHYRRAVMAREEDRQEAKAEEAVRDRDLEIKSFKENQERNARFRRSRGRTGYESESAVTTLSRARQPPADRPQLTIAERLTLPNARAIVNKRPVMVNELDLARSREYEQTGRIPSPQKKEKHPQRLRRDWRRTSHFNVSHTQLRRSPSPAWRQPVTETSDEEPTLHSPFSSPKYRSARQKRRKRRSQVTRMHTRPQGQHKGVKLMIKGKLKDPRQTSGEDTGDTDWDDTLETTCRPFKPGNIRRDDSDDDDRDSIRRNITIPATPVYPTVSTMAIDENEMTTFEEKTVTHKSAVIRSSQQRGAVCPPPSPNSPDDIEMNEEVRANTATPDTHMRGSQPIRPSRPSPKFIAAGGEDVGYLRRKPLDGVATCPLIFTDQADNSLPKPQAQLGADVPVTAASKQCMAIVPKYIPPHLRNNMTSENINPDSGRVYEPTAFQRYQQTVAADSDPELELPQGARRKLQYQEAPEDSYPREVVVWSGCITTYNTDAIVNAANETLLGGGGVDGAIHAAAGPLLRQECQELGGCKEGEAKITSAYHLPARYVIHTVGPQGYHPAILASCYDHCMQLMCENGLVSIAFPCIATGAFGFPREPACRIALSRVRKFLDEHPLMKIQRIVFNTFLPEDRKLYDHYVPLYFELPQGEERNDSLKRLSHVIELSQWPGENPNPLDRYQVYERKHGLPLRSGVPESATTEQMPKSKFPIRSRRKRREAEIAEERASGTEFSDATINETKHNHDQNNQPHSNTTGARRNERTVNFQLRCMDRLKDTPTQITLDEMQMKKRIGIINKRTAAKVLLARIRHAWCEAIRRLNSLNNEPPMQEDRQREMQRRAKERQEKLTKEHAGNYNQQAQYLRWLATQMVNVLSNWAWNSTRSITQEVAPVAVALYPAPHSENDETERAAAANEITVHENDYLTAIQTHRITYLDKQVSWSQKKCQEINRKEVQAQRREIKTQHALTGVKLPPIKRHQPGAHKLLTPNVQDLHMQLTQVRMERLGLQQMLKTQRIRIAFLKRLKRQIQEGKSYIESTDVNDLLRPIAIDRHQDLCLAMEKEECDKLAKKIQTMQLHLQYHEELREKAEEGLRSSNRSRDLSPEVITQLDGPDQDIDRRAEREKLKADIDDCTMRISTTVRELHAAENELEALVKRQHQVEQEERTDMFMAFDNDITENCRYKQRLNLHRRSVRRLNHAKRRMRLSSDSSEQESFEPAKFPVYMMKSRASRPVATVTADTSSPEIKKRKLEILAGAPGHSQTPIELSSEESHDMSNLTQTPVIVKTEGGVLWANEKEWAAEQQRRKEDDAQTDGTPSSDSDSEVEIARIEKTSNDTRSKQDLNLTSEVPSLMGSDNNRLGTDHNDTSTTITTTSNESPAPDTCAQKLSTDFSQSQDEDLSGTAPVETDEAEQVRDAGIQLLTSVAMGTHQSKMRQNATGTVLHPRPYPLQRQEAIPTGVQLLDDAWITYLSNNQSQRQEGNAVGVRKVVDYLQVHDIDQERGCMRSTQRQPSDTDVTTLAENSQSTKTTTQSEALPTQAVGPEWREDTRMVATTGEDSDESIFQSREKLTTDQIRVNSLVEKVKSNQDPAFQEVWRKTLQQIERESTVPAAPLELTDTVDDAIEAPDTVGTLKIRAVTFGSYYTAAEMRQQQEEDTDIAPVAQLVFAGEPHPGLKWFVNCSAPTQALARDWDRLVAHNGVLYRRWESKDGAVTRLQLILPHLHRARIISMLHDECTAGHLGVQKTMHRVQLRYFWYNMIEDVRRYIQTCDACQKRKRPHTTPRAPMKIFQTGAPFQRIAMDLCGKLVTTPRDNVYALVISDYFTKYTMILPIPDKTSHTVAAALATQWIVLWGCPQYIHTDQGGEFESALMHELCKRFGISKTRTTPYRPQSDGMVERFNQTMMQIVGTLCEAYTDWDLHLPFAQMAFNSTVHATTGETPNKIVQGRHLHMPLDVITQLDASDAEMVPQHEYVQQLENRLRVSHDIVRRHTARSMSRQKYYHDRGISYTDYQEDDLVLLKVMHHDPYVGKLSDKYEGPYVVIARKLNDTFLIQKDIDSKATTVQHNRLKPYFTNDTPDVEWTQEVRAKYREQTREDPEPVVDIEPAEETTLLTQLQAAEFSTNHAGTGTTHVLGTEAESTDGTISTVTASEGSCDFTKHSDIKFGCNIPSQPISVNQELEHNDEEAGTAVREFEIEEIVHTLGNSVEPITPDTDAVETKERGATQSSNESLRAPVVKRVTVSFPEYEGSCTQTMKPNSTTPNKKRKPGYDWQEIASEASSEKVAKNIDTPKSGHNTRFQRRQSLN